MPDNNKFLEDDLAILAEFVDESEADLNTAANHFVELEARPADLELINAIFRPLHSIKGNSAFLGLLQVRHLAHEMESLLDDLRKQRCAPYPELISTLLAGVDELKAILARIRKREKEVANESTFGKLIESVRRLRAGEPAAAASPPAATSPPIAAPPAAPAPDKAPESAAAVKEIGRTIRIPEKYLDELQNMQVLLSALHRQLTAPTTDINRLVQETAAGLAQTAAALDQQLAVLRFVPATELLQRAPRIARETAAATGKTVRVNILGDTLRLPRSLIGILETPLMHMVRNAVDHGIESPDARRRAGKPAEGQLWVEIREEKDAFILRIADDGPGIDFKALLTKALAQGLCTRDRSLTPADIVNLIFLPGLSTAKKVTDISGRGVGMDVVKSQIEAAGGKIQVSSKTGQGTEFIITLPRH